MKRLVLIGEHVVEIRDILQRRKGAFGAGTHGHRI